VVAVSLLQLTKNIVRVHKIVLVIYKTVKLFLFLKVSVFCLFYLDLIFLLFYDIVI
jgi:hypothetical protein